MVVNKIYDLQSDSLQESHRICFDWVPSGSRVLEFGPATGYMTRVLRDTLHCKVTGFEFSPEAAALASPFCEQIVVGDIEDFNLWAEFNPPYDVIIFADVLEHLRNPPLVLDRCYALLSETGRIIISVPNIAHWTVRSDLLKGKFEYASCGLLDNTHLRFFTKKSLFRMVETSGFRVCEMKFTRMNYPADKIFALARLIWLKKIFNRAFDHLFPQAAAYQLLVDCRPVPDFARPRNGPVCETVSA